MIKRKEERMKKELTKKKGENRVVRGHVGVLEFFEQKLYSVRCLIKPKCLLTVEWKLSSDRLLRGVSCHVFFRLNPTALV